MNHEKSLAALVNLAQATRAAKACPHTDINSTVRQCQASASQTPELEAAIAQRETVLAARAATESRSR